VAHTRPEFSSALCGARILGNHSRNEFAVEAHFIDGDEILVVRDF
jgi:hypothetical protein